ncbi:hypothetical protein Tco_1358785 [Tanacetum coccineum]
MDLHEKGDTCNKRTLKLDLVMYDANGEYDTDDESFGLSASEKKRKRSSKIIKEVFVKEDIVVDGMHRNLVPPPGVVGFKWLRDNPEGKEMYKKMEFVIKAKNDVVEARKIVKDNLDNLGQQM